MDAHLEGADLSDASTFERATRSVVWLAVLQQYRLIPVIGSQLRVCYCNA